MSIQPKVYIVPDASLTEEGYEYVTDLLKTAMNQARDNQAVEFREAPAKAPYECMADAVAKWATMGHFLEVQNQVLSNAMESENELITDLHLRSSNILKAITSIEEQMSLLYLYTFELACILENEEARKIMREYSAKFFEEITGKDAEQYLKGHTSEAEADDQ